MKFLTTFILAIFMMVTIAPKTFAQDTSVKVPQVRGEGAYLIDVKTGQTLFTKNPDKLLAPASTTKIMTGLLAIERGNLNDTITASSTMLNNKVVYGTQIYLRPGEKMLLKDYLYAMLLNSANDAAVAIAEHIGTDLPDFVGMMNQRAAEIGATKTHFLNPSGLTENGHVTTAHDLALIARVAYQNPLFAQYVRTKSHTISRSSTNVPTLMVNENKLLWRDSDVDGIKTGYTAAAENCLVASVTKDGRQFIGVILKSPGREIYTDMQDMFEYGFTQFKNTIYKPSGSVLSTITVKNESVNLIIDQPIYITQKINEQAPGLNLRIIPTNTDVLNSVEEGQVVAKAEILDGEAVLNSFPLKASRTVSPPQVQNKSLYSSFIPLIAGLILIGIFITLFNRKRYATRYKNREAMLTRRRESN
ncbi:MAG: D-alanyl-D-alanine carboxypeptidase family protein [Bacillota bacterium]|nr:D-alanyl-D-alanine carboxypeptidase family protein [Bacillota bacterium]